MYQARRARDQQLTVTKKEVERRKEPTDRQERRVSIIIINMVKSWQNKMR